MIYVFESKAGERQDIHFPVDEAPRIGDEILIDGVPFKRVPSFHINSAQIARVTHQYPRVSNSLPARMEGVKTVRQKRKDGSLTRSKPLITSQNHEKELMRQHDLARD